MKMLVKLVIMLLQVGLMPVAVAQDLRLDKSGSMANIPVHNQGDLGTCYAHAVAQGTDAFIHTFQPENNDWHTSTTMLATEYRDTFLTRVFSVDRDIEGGYTCATFRRAIKRFGACNEQEIEGMLGNMYLELNSAYRVKRLFRDLDNQFQETQKTARSSGEQAYQDGASKLTMVLLLAGAQASELPSLEETALGLRARTNLQFAHNFFKNLCASTARVKVPDAKCRNHHLWLRGNRGMSKLIRDVQNMLKQKNAQPVMISYCGNVLEKGRTYRGLGSFILDPIKTYECGYHASIIMGLRTIELKKNKIVQFLVRNSWGQGCAGYSSDWQCEAGNLWVDAEVLVRNMTDYQILLKRRH